MPLFENSHIHVHVHCDGQQKVIELLTEIRNILLVNSDNNNEAQLRQEIYDKLNHAIADIKSTIP